MPISSYFVEFLTLKSWCFEIWPRLFANRIASDGKSKCYIVESSKIGMVAAKATSWIVHANIVRMDFHAWDMRDEEGLNIRLRIAYYDRTEVLQWASESPEYKTYTGIEHRLDRLSLFLRKAIGTSSWSRTPLLPTLLLIQVCAAQKGPSPANSGSRLLFMEHRPWSEALSRYGSKYGLEIRYVSQNLQLSQVFRKLLPRRLWVILRSLRYGDASTIFRWRFNTAHHKIEPRFPSTPKVATEHYGQLNLNDPALHSDLFFWQESQIKGSDVILTFGSTSGVLDESKLKSMQEHGIEAVVSHPGATTIPGYYRESTPTRYDSNQIRANQKFANGPLYRWLKTQSDNYYDIKSHWTGLFSEHSVKVFLSWYKNDPSHVAIADAIRSLGGVSAIYQRTTEFHPSVGTTTAADVIFTYSLMASETFRLSESVTRYYITTGYLGDHRFKLLKTRAQILRSQLQQNGAQKIIALFDESYRSDHRWGTGLELVQDNYELLLQKVLDNPWFGLIIKPKNPSLIRGWLGQVNELLNKAEATGRCYVYDDSDGIQGAYPPAAAALSADIAVHSHLWPGTAGMEAALANVPTLLVDSEGWQKSPFYQLGEGRVIFPNMTNLWEECLSQWSAVRPDARFGDWAPLLDQLDPFRDGRAAERMGGYILDLLDGFQSGLSSESIVDNATERYSERWGIDKIVDAQIRLPSGPII